MFITYYVDTYFDYVLINAIQFIHSSSIKWVKAKINYYGTEISSTKKYYIRKAVQYLI